jgi:hypothetical protein
MINDIRNHHGPCVLLSACTSLIGLALPIVLPFTVSAQAPANFGPTLGANFSRWSTQNVSETIETRTGVVGGLAVNVVGGRMFSVQSEVLYAQKGARIPSQGEVFTYAMDWIQVPVLAQIRFPSSRILAVPYVLVGPSLAWRARCVVTFEGGSESCDDIGLEIKELDFSGVVGVGVELGALTLSARYDVGFTNISDEPGESVKSRVITLMMGFLVGRSGPARLE